MHFPILSYRGISEKSSVRNDHIILITTAWKNQAWYPKTLQMGIRNPILILRTDDLLLKPQTQKHPLVTNKTLPLVAWVISEKSLLQDYQNARRKGAINHYGSSWRKWNSWCCEQTLDPIRCNINPVLKFLTELFHGGLEYNTTCSYRSAISACHEAIGSFAVRKHPHAINLMIGIFNKKLPKPRYTFIWDVETITSFLDTLNSNKIELKKLLTFILTMMQFFILFPFLKDEKQQGKIK